MTVPRSKIGWCDYSGGDLNFALRGSARGDCEVSPGCAHCYAGAILRRNGQTSPVTTWSTKKLNRLAKWQPDPGAEPYRRGPGSRPLAFPCDMGDLFHEAVPEEFIFQALDLMYLRSDVDWQILTKRAERMSELTSRWYLTHRRPFAEHLWLGVSVEDMARADERIPWLLATPARVRFLSCEPLLGPLWFERCTAWDLDQFCLDGIDWVIVGAESGPDRRPFDMLWAAEIRDQCRATATAYFYKQGSHRFPGRDDVLDGHTYKEFPR